MKAFKYTNLQIIIHWLTAVLVIFLLITGTFVLSDMPNSPAKLGNLRIHLIIGASIALLVITRLMLSHRMPKPPALSGHRLAKIGHLLLSLILIILVLSGGVLSYQSGLFEALFGSGALPSDFMIYTLRKIHGLASRVAMGLIALHILAAAYHQFIKKDALLARMGVGRS